MSGFLEKARQEADRDAPRWPLLAVYLTAALVDALVQVAQAVLQVRDEVRKLP